MCGGHRTRARLLALVEDRRELLSARPYGRGIATSHALLLLAAAHCCSLLLAIARCCPLLLVAASRCRDRSQGNQSIDLELRVLKIELVQEVISRQEPSRLPRSRIQSASNARSVDRCTRLSTLKIRICIACRKAAYTAGWRTNLTFLTRVAAPLCI